MLHGVEEMIVIDLNLVKEATLQCGAGAYRRKRRSLTTFDSSASIGAWDFS